MTDSNLIDNSATVGGGIGTAGGMLTVNNSVFSNNSADLAAASKTSVR